MYTFIFNYFWFGVFLKLIILDWYMLFYVSIVHYFLFLSSDLLYSCSTICSFIYVLTDIWIYSSFQQLQITLCCEYLYTNLCMDLDFIFPSKLISFFFFEVSSHSIQLTILKCTINGYLVYLQCSAITSAF